MRTSPMRADFFIRSITALNAIATGALSFRATASWATHSHLVPSGWGWVVPLVIEAGVIAAGGSAFRRRRSGDAIRLEMSVMAGLLGVSMVIQQAAAQSDGATILARVIAALLPAILLVGVEIGLRAESKALAVRQAAAAALAETERREAERVAAREARANRSVKPAKVTPAQVTATPAASDQGVTVLHAVPAGVIGTDRAQIVAELIEQHGAVCTGAMVAEALGVSASQGRRILQQRRAA